MVSVIAMTYDNYDRCPPGPSLKRPAVGAACDAYQTQTIQAFQIYEFGWKSTEFVAHEVEFLQRSELAYFRREAAQDVVT